MPFLDYLDDPVALLSRDGQVADANNAFISLCKLPRSQAIGQDSRAVEPLSLCWPLITSALLHRREQRDRLKFDDSVLDITVKPVLEGEITQYVLVLIRDITESVRLDEDLRKRNQELIVMNTLSAAFIGANNIEAVFGDLLEKVLLVSGMEMGWITILDADGHYAVKGVAGFPDSFGATIEDETFRPIYENASRSSKPIHVLEKDDIRKIPFLEREGVAMIAMIPLRAGGGGAIGFMGLATRNETAFDYDIATMFSSIGNHISLIAEKIMLFQETQRLSVTDALTGLYNSRHFYQCLDSEISRSKRYHERFSVVLFDVDNFKAFNDRYGHQTGDEVLVEIAAHMRTISRASDVLSRYGGEEFIMLLPHTSKDEAVTLASRLMQAIGSRQFLGSQAMQVTISGGVSTYPEDAEEAKALLYASDMAMYEAKEKGKKQICAYKAK